MVARLAGVGVAAELVVVETEGDRRADVALTAIAGRGVFTKEVQEAVLDGRADVAVHSAKDLPPVSPLGLVLAAVPERGDPADCLVGRPLQVLPPGATVATGAPRRRALLLEARPDLNVVGLRGNIARRLAALDGDVDAVVVAAVALERLGLSGRIAERLDPERFVPQVGQGALALECGVDGAALAPLSEIQDHLARTALDCERSFLAELGAGCDVPAGAFATVEGDVIVLRGVLLSEDGSDVVRGVGDGADPETTGRELAARLRAELARPATT